MEICKCFHDANRRRWKNLVPRNFRGTLSCRSMWMRCSMNGKQAKLFILAQLPGKDHSILSKIFLFPNIFSARQILSPVEGPSTGQLGFAGGEKRGR